VGVVDNIALKRGCNKGGQLQSYMQVFAKFHDGRGMDAFFGGLTGGMLRE
jgi:hypothetical protein